MHEPRSSCTRCNQWDTVPPSLESNSILHLVPNSEKTGDVLRGHWTQQQFPQLQRPIWSLPQMPWISFSICYRKISTSLKDIVKCCDTDHEGPPQTVPQSVTQLWKICCLRRPANKSNLIQLNTIPFGQAGQCACVCVGTLEKGKTEEYWGGDGTGNTRIHQLDTTQTKRGIRRWFCLDGYETEKRERERRNNNQPDCTDSSVLWFRMLTPSCCLLMLLHSFAILYCIIGEIVT